MSWDDDSAETENNSPQRPAGFGTAEQPGAQPGFGQPRAGQPGFGGQGAGGPTPQHQGYPNQGGQQGFPNHPSQQVPTYPNQGAQQGFPSHPSQQVPTYPNQGAQQGFPNHPSQQVPTYPNQGAQQGFPNHPSQQVPTYPNHGGPHQPGQPVGTQPAHGGQQQHFPNELSQGMRIPGPGGFGGVPGQPAPSFGEGQSSPSVGSPLHGQGTTPGGPTSGRHRMADGDVVTPQERMIYASSGATFGAVIGTFLGLMNAALEDQSMVEGFPLLIQLVVWFALFIGILAAWRPDRFESLKNKIFGSDEGEAGSQ